MAETGLVASTDPIRRARRAMAHDRRSHLVIIGLDLRGWLGGGFLCSLSLRQKDGEQAEDEVSGRPLCACDCYK